MRLMRIMRIMRRGGLILALPLLCQLMACAICDQENRRLLNKLDKTVKPKTTTSRVAMAPVAIPVGMIALATDAVVINPVVVVPKAGKDVYDLYWSPREMDSLRRTLIFPVIVALTPPTFAGDWLLRAAFMGND